MSAVSSIAFSTGQTKQSDLLAVIVAGYDKGVNVHGDLDLPLHHFREHIQTVVDKCVSLDTLPAQLIDFVRQLHMEDLYLARACADRGEKAWNRFDTLYHKYLNDLIGYLSSIRHIALELMETVMIDLFLPDRAGRSRIASYDGRSALSTWLRVVVTNRIINEGQRKSLTSRVEISGDFVDSSAVSCLDSDIAIRRYEDPIRNALRSACASLSMRDRMILLGRFDEEKQLGDIASLLNVHQSTITRTVERIARKLRQHLIANLSECRLDRAGIEECVGVLIDGRAHSISILDFIRAAEPESK